MEKQKKIFIEIPGPQNVDEDKLVSTLEYLGPRNAKELAEEIICKSGFIIEFDSKEPPDLLILNLEKIGVEVKRDAQ